MRFFKRFNYRLYREAANKWINSKQGVKFRFGLLGATVTIPAIWMISMDGPFLGISFKRRFRGVDYYLSEHLGPLTDEEYERWLVTSKKSTNKSSATFSCQADATSSLDSICKGTLATRFGAQIALPFYARFLNEGEAAEYCEKNLEPFKFLGKTLCILWDSDVGKELISTFTLSRKALSFLMARDLRTVESSPFLTNMPVTWTTWMTFSSMAIFIAHKRLFNGTAVSFFASYSLMLAITAFGSREWHKSFRYLTDCHADSSSSRLSYEHCEGGNEYYTKFLKRNRILRSLMDSKDAKTIFTEVGDVRSAVTPYFLRFDLVRDVSMEGDQLRSSVQGDD